MRVNFLETEYLILTERYCCYYCFTRDAPIDEYGYYLPSFAARPGAHDKRWRFDTCPLQQLAKLAHFYPQSLHRRAISLPVGCAVPVIVGMRSAYALRLTDVQCAAPDAPDRPPDAAPVAGFCPKSGGN